MGTGMRRFCVFLTIAALLLCGGCGVWPGTGQKRYQTTDLTLFDTVTTITGQASSEAEFQARAGQILDELTEYHRLFDIYNRYEGLNNLKTVNDQAGIAPVEVDGRIIELLLSCREIYEMTDGRVNAAMGSVLALWHEARNEGVNDPEHAALPDETALEEAAEHCSFGTVLIDEEAGTVFLTDPNQSLDVGAVAKGWSVQRVCAQAPSGLLVSVGGNVCATGPKEESGTAWVVGIQNPDGGDYLHTISLTQGSVVTSGDYQRTYTVDGVAYHHIIDPDTLYPGTLWRAVTVVCADSGVADALSTALFLLPREEGQALLDRFDAEAMWVSLAGTVFYSPGFEALIRT